MRHLADVFSVAYEVWDAQQRDNVAFFKQEATKLAP